MIKYDNNLKIFSSSLINDDFYFISGFSTKALGDGRKINVIFDFFQKNKFSFKKIVVLEQIHSTNINFFNSKTNSILEKISDTDGVITKDKETVLIVRNADCLPLVFVEKENGLIGISHQGWRGSIKRMAKKMVDKMLELGGKKEKIIVGFGPAIGQCCYHIDEERYYQFKQEFDGYSDKIFSYRQGKIFLNLSLLNYLLLLDEGVSEKNIDFFPFCTKCDKNRFFSFRRDNKKNYGEMFNFIFKN
jgi:YfiH family protein